MIRRNRMMLKAKDNAEKRNRWLEKLLRRIEMIRRVGPKPHEMVADTTVARAPEFYDGLKNLFTDDPRAELKKGLVHLHREEYPEALACYLKAARAGCSEACFKIGTMYMHGRGKNPDLNLAEIWFREAAKGEFAARAAESLRLLEWLRTSEYARTYVFYDL